eukprot:CAMPEP_0206008360 /NCGR_PEP_ID=MMETSP1464-20131121/7310_1 /ASSEMBLY_ACC=CAM_ASM_001124 /TAXON_ID=119497 /ORGANISM="Exanthemachrysis gayraliae, Strain RCC1523" /LENGTH=125 /DNA_ID=CAMNT_0053381897 /DNA_START=47 /DNA_END=424 /DNA_ORIENTATION=-
MAAHEDEDPMTADDQKKINQFSRTNARRHELEEDIAQLKKENEELGDLTDEICLLDDEEPIKYKFGDSYFEVDKSKAEELIEGLAAAKKGELEGLEQELEVCTTELSQLKTQLYAKFGTNINLEE